jgi:hypothetical protein
MLFSNSALKLYKIYIFSYRRQQATDKFDAFFEIGTKKLVNSTFFFVELTGIGSGQIWCHFRTQSLKISNISIFFCVCDKWAVWRYFKFRHENVFKIHLFWYKWQEIPVKELDVIFLQNPHTFV